MTCVATVVHEGRAYLGGDSAAAAADWDLGTRADAKVFALGEFLMGFTTSFRMGQLLRYALTPPPLPESDHDLFRYMVADFVEATRECLKRGGFAKKDSEREEGGTFLVGIRGRIFNVHSDYQVEETTDGYGAIGCGSAYAKGAMFTTAGLLPERRIRTALRAAERHSAGVRGPFIILGPDGQTLE